MTGPLLSEPGTVSAALDALQATIRAALPAPVDGEEVPDAVDVFDGPDSDRPFSRRSVTVAAPFEDDQSAVIEDRSTSGLGSRLTQTFDVACSAYVGSGAADDQAIDEHRASMGAILTAIDQALQDDPTLGGEVARAFLSSATWLQGRDEAGAGVMVGFIVSMVVLP